MSVKEVPDAYILHQAIIQSGSIIYPTLRCDIHPDSKVHVAHMGQPGPR